MPCPALRAVVYVRDLAHEPVCREHCERAGHRIVGIVYDPAGTRYHEALRAALDGHAEVVVVRSLEDLPPDRVPRTEVVDQAGRGPVRPRQRRPRHR